MPDFAVRTAFTAVDRLSPAFKRMDQNASMLTKTMGTLKTFIGFAMVGTFVDSVVTAAASLTRLETAYKSVFGKDSVTQMNFVADAANRLGLNFESTADAYKGIAASAIGTSISNKVVQETFLGVSEAAAALQLPAEQAQGALLAISQIISKGKVSMEELRGQLGERLPGAMKTAADSMGVTQAEFEKMVASGLSAEKFIPRFAAALREKYGKAALDASTSFNAASNKFNNSLFMMKATIGKDILPILSTMMDFISKNSDLILKLVYAVGIITGAYVAWKIALLAVHTTQKLIIAVGWVKYLWMMRSAIMMAVTQTNLWAIAQRVINFLLAANPIGLVIIAVGALAYAIYDLYTNWEKYQLGFSVSIQNFITGFARAKMEVYELLNAIGLISDKELTGAKLNFLDNFTKGAKLQVDQIRANREAPNATEAEGKYSSNTTVNINSNGTEAKAAVSGNGQAKINMNKPMGANI